MSAISDNNMEDILQRLKQYVDSRPLYSVGTLDNFTGTSTFEIGFAPKTLKIYFNSSTYSADLAVLWHKGNAVKSGANNTSNGGFSLIDVSDDVVSLGGAATGPLLWEAWG